MSGVVFASSFDNFYYFDLSNSNILIWSVTLGLYLLLLGQIFEMYNLETSNDYYKILRGIVATSFTITGLYIFTPFISPELPMNRLQIFYLFLAISIPLIIWRIIYIVFVFSPKYFRTILIIGEAEEIKNLLLFIKEKAPTNQIVACISNQNFNYEEMRCFDFESANIKDIVNEHSVSEMIIAHYNSKKYGNIHSQLVELFENGMAITSVKKFKQREAAMIPELKIDDDFYDVITFSMNHQNKIYLVFSRIMDIVVSSIGLLFLVLFIPVILIANVIANKGKLFYYQFRVGKNGELFEILKLRTMVKNAEINGAELAVKNDSRVTPFGKFLRKTRLDEVPQFLNILKGDMALIGPRPERPEFVEELKKQLPFYVTRHIIKPGLTGWAQVMHPYANTLKDQDVKMRYDLYYIKKRGAILDFKILVNTITTVLFFRGQ